MNINPCLQVSFIYHIFADSLVIENDIWLMAFFIFKDQQLPAVSLPRSLGQGQHASGQGLLHSPLSIPPVAAAERHGMYR